MDFNEINRIFDQGMDLMQKGRYSEAASLFQKAKSMTEGMERIKK